MTNEIVYESDPTWRGWHKGKPTKNGDYLCVVIPAEGGQPTPQILTFNQRNLKWVDCNHLGVAIPNGHISAWMEFPEMPKGENNG